MKFSEQWLREWVNPALDAVALSEQLSMAGLEVDAVEPVAPAFSNVVIGEVVECAQHPDADKLRVTKVNVGDEELLDIVCGAPNCRTGLKVMVAKVGAVLPGNFEIKKAKLRGQPSCGMLCSYDELGMDGGGDGIAELPSDAPIGQSLRDYLQLDDNSIDVDLTPNRADCLGLRGLAREVGVLNQLSVNEPVIDAVAPTISDSISVTLSAPDACPRYLGRVIRNIDLNQSAPLWLTERLRRSGIRSIDPVVDVTNYVLLELGHPMHAFDLKAISGGIEVRLARAEEKLTLLDGNEVNLSSDTLVIADSEKALAMAGIFGGLHSGVTETTTDIFLESAFFAPLAITGRARSYGLHTDASHRYERGVDPELQRTAMERATALLLSIVGGEAGPIVEAVAEQHLPVRATVTLRKARLAKKLGVTIADEQVTDILSRLGMVVAFDGQQWQAKAPSYRFDIAIEEDLIEEVARVFGYNNIANVAPVASLKMTDHQEAAVPLRNLRNTLVTRGYQEAITYSFVDPKVQNRLFPDNNAMVLPHPISADMSAMRVSLWPGLVQSALYNQNRQQSRVRLIETGLKFITDATAENGVAQIPMIGGIATGTVAGERWSDKTRAVDFFDVKGDVEALIALTGEAQRFSFVRADHSALHPGQSAAIVKDDKVVGYLGTLHPEHHKKLGLTGAVVVFEIEVAALAQRRLPWAGEISKFPANRRDLALVVAESVNAADILNVIKKVGGNQLVDLNLFDVYQGQGVAPGFKSLAVALTLQDVARTLEEQEINQLIQNVVNALIEQFNASLRD